MKNTRFDLQSMTKKFSQVTEQIDQKSNESQNFLWMSQMNYFFSNIQESDDKDWAWI